MGGTLAKNDQAIVDRFADSPTGAVYAGVAFVLYFLIVLLPTILGSADLMGTRVRFYARLRGPSWRPPSWLFGIVWLVLYHLIWLAALFFTVSGVVVDATTGAVQESIVTPGGTRSGYVAAIVLFAVTHVLNIAWTPLFFGFRLFGVAAFVAFAMMGCAVATAILFLYYTVVGAAFMFVYSAWLAFALVLNIYYATANPQELQMAPLRRGGRRGGGGDAPLAEAQATAPEQALDPNSGADD